MKPGPQTSQALEMIAQMDRIEATQTSIRAEQTAARERREQLTVQLEQLKRIEATGERVRRQRRRDALTAQYGPILFD